MKQMTPTEKRPTTPITMRMPVDVVEDLKTVARIKEMSGYQSLIKFYVGQGLRADLAALRVKSSAEKAREVLKKYDVDPEIVQEVEQALREESGDYGSEDR